MLKSKFSFLQYYFTLVFLTVFILGPAVYLLSSPTHKTYNRKIGISIMQVYPGLLLLLLFLFAAYFLLTKIPRVTIDADGLFFRAPGRNKTISWNDIETIDVHTSDILTFLFLSQRMEATTITTTSGEKTAIFEGYYRNMPAIRMVLNRALALKTQRKNIGTHLSFDIPVKPAGTTQEADESAHKYSDSFIISINGILFIAMIAGVGIALLLPGKTNTAAITAAAFFILLFYFVFGTQSYYFFVSDTHLFIRNHLFFWYRKVYVINDIAEVTTENASKRSTALRVITKGFQSNAYGAGSLRDTTWKKLLAKLRQRGISVRREA